MDFQEKRRVKKLLYSKIVIGLLIFLFLIIANAIFGVFTKYKEARDNKDIALRKFEELEQHKNYVEEELKRLETKDGVEGEIREKYNFTKEGEGVVIIVDPSYQNGTPEESDAEGAIKRFLGNIFGS